MINLIVKRKVQRDLHIETLQMEVRIPYDRLTPKAARAALEIAFGQPHGGTVTDPETGTAYRVYERSARKVQVEW